MYVFSSISKITDTTSMIANLAQATRNSYLRKSTTWAPSSTEAGAIMSAAVVSKSSQISKTKAPSKFKTGSIMVTAVQTSATVKKRNRKNLKSNHSVQQSQSYVHHQSHLALPMVKQADTDTEASNVQEFVKKVKTKIKKKKSKHSGSGAAGVKEKISSQDA